MLELKLLHLCFLISFHYYNSVCVADLYQVNETRTLCYSDIAEFLCSQHLPYVYWTVTNSATGNRTFLSFHTNLDPVRMKTTTVDSTIVKAQVMSSNSSIVLSLLEIDASITASINCNNEIIMYHPKTIEKPSQITLTPLTSSSSRYRVTWIPSHYHYSRYMITVYPPESYTPEDLIIHNTDNSTVHNITIALNDCPHRIYSTFTLCCTLFNTPEVLNYRVALTGEMNAQLFANVTVQCTTDIWEKALITSSTTYDYTQQLTSTSPYSFNNTSTNPTSQQISFEVLGIILGVIGVVITTMLGIVAVCICLNWSKGRKIDGHHSKSNLQDSTGEIDVDAQYSTIQDVQCVSRDYSKVMPAFTQTYSKLELRSCKEQELTNNCDKVCCSKDDQLSPADQLLNLDSLLFKLNPISSNFKLLGSLAGISTDLLDQIESSVVVPHDGLVEVCNAWLRKCEDDGVTLTWKMVADILATMGHQDLSFDNI